jgi:hypothetical protein
VIKRIIAVLAIAAFVCFGSVLAEDSAPVVLNATAIIQTGAILTVSSNTVHFTVPPATSMAEDGTFIAQDSPAITGFLSWKFVPGHRAALRFTSSDFMYEGVPFSPTGMIKYSVSGTPYTGTGPVIAVVDAALTTPAPQEIWVSVLNNGYIPDLLFTYKFIRSLLSGGGTCTWQMTYTVFDIV